MSKRTLSLWILLFLCGAASTKAQAPIRLASCQPPADPNRKDFVIDVANDSTSGRRKYKLTDETRIVLINKNPFAVDYKLTIEETEVAEPALQRFLRAFPFIDKIIPETTAPAPAGAPAPSAKAPAADPCAGQLTPLRQQIESVDAQIAVEDTGIQTDLKTLLSNHRSLVQNIDPHLKDMAQDKVVCADLQTSVTAFLTAVDAAQTGLDVQPLQLRIKGLKDQLVQQGGRVETYVETVSPACRASIRDEVRHWHNQVAVATGNVAKAEAKVAELDAAIKELKEQSQEVREIGSRTEAFYEVHIVGPFDAPTDVNVELKTRKKDSQKPEDFKLATKSKLNFGGGSVFSLSAGIAFAHLEDQTFKRIQGFARPSPGAEPDTSAVKPVVGLDEDSEWRTAPLVLIHGRFWESDSSRLGLHVSFGLSAKIENGDTDAEYLAGLSLSFAKRLFVTVGGYHGGVNRLAGDLFEGAALPTDVPEPPVKVDHTWKLGGALTYRIQ